MKVLHADKRINYVMHLLHLDTIFEIYDDEDAAVESFRELRTRAWTG